MCSHLIPTVKWHNCDLTLSSSNFLSKSLIFRDAFGIRASKQDKVPSSRRGSNALMMQKIAMRLNNPTAWTVGTRAVFVISPEWLMGRQLSVQWYFLHCCFTVCAFCTASLTHDPVKYDVNSARCDRALPRCSVMDRLLLLQHLQPAHMAEWKFSIRRITISQRARQICPGGFTFLFIFPLLNVNYSHTQWYHH